MHEELENFERN
jgi:hypothetical protein